MLEVRGLTLPRADAYGTDLQDIHLQVRAGEVLGIAGVSGNGQQELMAALSGEDPRAAPGSITLGGSRHRAAPARASGVRWACTLCPKSAWAAAPCPR